MQKETSEKKYIIRNFAEFARKYLCRNLFFAKAKLCNFTKNESLAQVFSCEFCKTYKNTFFAEHHPTTVLIITLSIAVKRELASKTVNYGTKTKAYVPI